jgi:hypothetical protein
VPSEEQSGAAGPEPRTPIPLYIGACGTALVVTAFACAYFYAGETTTRGWCATFAAGFELCGVLLVASPELRPIVETLARRAAAEVTTWPVRVSNRLKRLFGKPVHHRVSSGSALSVEGALQVEGQRGFQAAPPGGATQSEQVEYLLNVVEQFKRTLNTVENDLRKGIENVRGEIQRTALDLTEQTTDAVRQLAQSELRMRLLGVGCIIVGLMLSYAANIA